MLRVVAIAFMLRFSQGLLPPQFQETLLCPQKHCLARKDVPFGFTGPKHAYFTCVSPKSTLDPIGWIATDGDKVMQTFLGGGWHSRPCSHFGDGLALD